MVVRVEIFLEVCVFNHHDDYEQLFVVDFVLAGGVDLLRTRRRQMEFRTRCEEVEKMLVEKSKGRKRSGDGGVGVKFLEEVEEEIRKKNRSHSSDIHSTKCARRRVDIMKKAFVEELLAIVMCMLFNIRLILQRYK